MEYIQSIVVRYIFSFIENLSHRVISALEGNEKVRDFTRCQNLKGNQILV